MEADYLRNQFMFLCGAERHRQTQNEIEVSSIYWHCVAERVENMHTNTLTDKCTLIHIQTHTRSMYIYVLIIVR